MSRLTFRNRQADICYQKQLRDRYVAQGCPVENLDLRFAVIRPVSYSFARSIILKYEWLGTMAPTSEHFGIFFGNFCAGVTCVGNSAGANSNSYKEFCLEPGQLAYLARGANVHWSPLGANSKLVSWTCKLLSAKKYAKAIIAYSDSDAGEIGTIYQACNWTYIGCGSSTLQWIAPNGRIYDAKKPSDLARDRGGSRQLWVKKLRDAGWTQQESNPKHRYVFVLDKSDKILRDVVEKKRQSYPKRGQGEIDNAADTNLQTGGARPT